MPQLDPKAFVREIAAEIVKFPDGTDFARGEAGALSPLLTGKPEERDPLKYAEIFRIAAANLAATPWMLFACRSEYLNGRRRATGADMPVLADELDQLVADASNELDNNAQKYLLLGNVLWNVAMVRRGLRRYLEAASAQRESSAWFGLAGDVAKQLTGIFAAQVEEVTAAFVGGDDQKIASSIHALIAARAHVRDALPEYPGWMQANAATHIAWPIIMARLVGATTLLPTYGPDFDAAKKSGMVQWEKVFKVHEDLSSGMCQEVVSTAPVVLESSSVNNATLSVQIFRAMAEQALGHVAESRGRLRAVAGHQGPDGGIPIAVAKRLLA